MKKSDFSSLISFSRLSTALYNTVVLFSVTASNLFYSKEKYFKDINQFVTQTEINYANFTLNEWYRVDLDFNIL